MLVASLSTTQHQQLLQLYLRFIREHASKLSTPNDLSLRAVSLELVLVILHVARATTAPVRYDASRWLQPYWVPEGLRRAWPLDERAQMMEKLISLASWREEEAWRAAAEMGAAATRREIKKVARAAKAQHDKVPLIAIRLPYECHLIAIRSPASSGGI